MQTEPLILLSHAEMATAAAGCMLLTRRLGRKLILRSLHGEPCWSFHFGNSMLPTGSAVAFLIKSKLYLHALRNIRIRKVRMCVYFYTHTHIYIYTHIWRARKRERERERGKYVHMDGWECLQTGGPTCGYQHDSIVAIWPDEKTRTTAKWDP